MQRLGLYWRCLAKKPNVRKVDAQRLQPLGVEVRVNQCVEK
ncbi:Uncharacterised protein [Serratia proteamaculans]|nr:Uncharacterised protein [Serratia proteamaculans]